jgi:hypothetical protein
MTGSTLTGSMVPNALRGSATARQGQHDHAKRNHRQAHELDYQNVHDNFPLLRKGNL